MIDKRIFNGYKAIALTVKRDSEGRIVKAYHKPENNGENTMTRTLNGVSYNTRRTVGEGTGAEPRFFTWRPNTVSVVSFDEALVDAFGRGYASAAPSEMRSRIISFVKRRVFRYVRAGTLTNSSVTVSKVGDSTYLVLNGIDPSSGKTEAIPFARFGQGATTAYMTKEVYGLSEADLESICKDAKKHVRETATAGDVSRNIVRHLESGLVAPSEAFKVSASSTKMWIVPSAVVMERIERLCSSGCATAISFPITRKDKDTMASMLESKIKDMIGRVKDVVDSDPTSTSYVREFKEAQSQIAALSSVLGGHAGKLEKVLSRAQAEVKRRVGVEEEPTAEATAPLESSQPTPAPDNISPEAAAILAKYTS